MNLTSVFLFNIDIGWFSGCETFLVIQSVFKVSMFFEVYFVVEILLNHKQKPFKHTLHFGLQEKPHYPLN